MIEYISDTFMQALSSGYWSRYEEFHKLFSDLPDTEKLMTGNTTSKNTKLNRS